MCVCVCVRERERERREGGRSLFVYVLMAHIRKFQPVKAQKLVLRAIISGILKEARHHTHKHSKTKDYIRVHLILIEVSPLINQQV